MIVLCLQGGLGNQMFQYAFGRELTSRGRRVLYDLSSFDSDPLRSFELDVWRTTVPRAPKKLTARRPKRNGGDGWRSLLRGALPLRCVRELPFGYDERFLSPPNGAYLDGYWQSEKYFPSVRDEIAEAYRPATRVSPESLAVARRIEATDAIAVHVRRTDYLQHGYTQVCGADYHQRCVEDLLAKHPGLEAFVFSDDLRWCEAKLRFACPTHYVGHNRGATSYEDLWLMSRCRRHVIANSSFSWWGAWLKEDPAGEVYAPQPWFQGPKLDCSSVVPERWLTTPGESHRQAA